MMISQRVAQQSLRRCMSGPEHGVIELEHILTRFVIPLLVAVQQPYALRWSVLNSAAPAAIAAGRTTMMQTR